MGDHAREQSNFKVCCTVALGCGLDERIPYFPIFDLAP
jgi:hypothetical protein